VNVIGKEVEQALAQAVVQCNVQVSEFTVAPQINPTNGLPYHEWFIEFEQEPLDLEAFAQEIDQQLRIQNTYYNDLIEGKVLRSLVISRVAQNGFQDYMKSVGKLGGQNKIPRLANDRILVDQLIKI
jgi:hypothetical protein